MPLSSYDMVQSKENVAMGIVAWVKSRIKRRLKNRSLNRQELERLLQAVRMAGYAEGYARARFENSLGPDESPTLSP